MPEKINLSDLIRSSRHKDDEKGWLEWALMALIADEKLGRSLDDWIVKEDDGKDYIIDVDMKINDQPVRFSMILERMRLEFDKQVNDAANRIAEEKMNDIIMGFQDTIKQAEDKIREQLGIENNESW